MALFSFFTKNKLTDQLKESSQKFSESIKQVFTHKKIDENFLEELEESLISSDMGVKTATKIIDDFRKEKFAKNVDENEIKLFLAKKIEEILGTCDKNLEEVFVKSPKKPQILIFNGVNGAGKTTTIGKIAHNLTSKKNKVLIAACDTFRAAAASQLQVWAKKSNCEIICALKDGEDPASVAYKALEFAKENDFDFLLIDTAGRLQNKQNLMDELKKINNVLKKNDSEIAIENLLILDATIGQNAKNQLEVFDKIINISGLIMTKLDGSSKGGILVALCNEFQKPIYAIGVGEKIEDLQEFSAENFTKNLLNL